MLSPAKVSFGDCPGIHPSYECIRHETTLSCQNKDCMLLVLASGADTELVVVDQGFSVERDFRQKVFPSIHICRKSVGVGIINAVGMLIALIPKARLSSFRVVLHPAAHPVNKLAVSHTTMCTANQRWRSVRIFQCIVRGSLLSAQGHDKWLLPDLFSS